MAEVYTGREFVERWNGNGGLVGWGYTNRGKLGVAAGAIGALILREYTPKLIQAYQIGSGRNIVQAFREAGLIVVQGPQTAQTVVGAQPHLQIPEATFYQSVMSSLNKLNEKVDTFSKVTERVETLEQELREMEAGKKE